MDQLDGLDEMEPDDQERVRKAVEVGDLEDDAKSGDSKAQEQHATEGTEGKAVQTAGEDTTEEAEEEASAGK